MNIVQEESLRYQKKLKRRVLILEIARGLIASKGLRSLKVRDIAEAADCSIGSVYNEFRDFDGVILTVNRETVQALTARLVAVPKDDPLRQLQVAQGLALARHAAVGRVARARHYLLRRARFRLRSSSFGGQVALPALRRLASARKIEQQRPAVAHAVRQDHDPIAPG